MNFALPRPRRLWNPWLIALGIIVTLVLTGMEGPGSPEELPLAILRSLLSVCLWALIGYYGLRGRSNADDRSIFAECVADMLTMGIPVSEAVDHQAYETNSRFTSRYAPTAWALPAVAARLRSGTSLSEAIGRERSFPPFWTTILAAAEKRDDLPQGLRLVASLERQGGVLVRGTLIRSLVLIGMLGIVTSFLSAYIFPTFVSIFENTGNQVGLQRMGTLKWYPVLLLPVTLGIIVFLVPPLRRILSKVTGFLPGVWPLTRAQDQALATTAMAAALRLGFPLPQTFALAASVVTCPAYRNAFNRLARGEGDSVAHALDRYPRLFDPTLRWLVSQGEVFSTLPDVLQTASAWFTEEADRCRIRLSAVVNVGLTTVLGLLVGYMCVVVFTTLTGVAVETLSQAVLP